MSYPSYDSEKAFGANRLEKGSSEAEFDDFWPSETRGDGKTVKNNINTGSAQGKSSLLRKSHCRLCGFPNNLSSIDHSGGSLDGEGAGGGIATATASAPVSGGGTHTENYGTQSYRNAAGCALCMSKNSTKIRIDVLEPSDPFGQPKPLGF